MTQTFFVRFTSNALNSPEYIGPFYSEDSAYDYADDRNGSLALSGIPSSVASYSVTNSWTQMNRTLSQVKEFLELLIEQQGADASCAALIFTKEDVFTMDENGNEVYYDEEITNNVLNDLDETDWVLQKGIDCITDYIGDYIGESVK